MNIRCVECAHFSLRTAGAMARNGFGHCVEDKKDWEYMSAFYKHDCEKFNSAGDDVSKKRIQWLRKR